MEIIGTLIIGLLAGALAKLIMPGDDPGGIIMTMLLGVAGAFLARWIGQAVGWYGPEDNAGFIASVVGSIVLLLLYRMLFGRRGRGRVDRVD